MSEPEFFPVTSKRWKDLEKLFGKNGACAGCWCMWFRMPRSKWDQGRGESNKTALKKLIDSKEIVVGLLAYIDDKPAGWISFGKREEFPAVENSRLFKRVDDLPVWSVVCFFVGRPFRRSGLTEKLLKAATLYAQENGARILEGYPIDRKQNVPDLYAYHGFVSVFRKNGFEEVARRSETRPMMRKKLNAKKRRKPNSL